MSCILQNKSEQLMDLVKKVQESSSRGDLQRCFDQIQTTVERYFDQDQTTHYLTQSIAWQVVCDLLEARLLGLCTEDMDIPFYHKDCEGKDSAGLS
jgi:signal-transduction protein with cAMP-binding, CBS, and nucleotidyltransferase domain